MYALDSSEESLNEIALIKSRSEASSPWGHDRTTNYNENSEDEDSDVEFAVHPILRSLIKSKSAYTIKEHAPKMTSSKTAFELSLSKMLDSTQKRILEESEPAVANFCTSLDQKWPEPESPKKKKNKEIPPLRKMSSCWSSPPNIILDDNISISSFDSAAGRASCWSAPEYGEEEESEESEESTDNETEQSISESRHFSNSYPVIETPEHVPSQCSIRVPSQLSPASSLSPPRPLTPVLGRPANYASMSSSRSMQLRPCPALSDVCSAESSDDEWPQKEPWPEQEVWPEADPMLSSARSGWMDDTPAIIPRSSSVQFSNVAAGGMRSSRSAHGRLHVQPEEAETLERASNCADSIHSTHSQLDEMESYEFARRSAWLERGSIVQLSADLGAEHDWTRLQNRYAHVNNGMRRSVTTEEFRRGRRKLPRRPDVAVFGGHLPSSISMYDQGAFDENADPRILVYGSSRMVHQTPSLRGSIQMIPTGSAAQSRIRPPTLPVRQQGGHQGTVVEPKYAEIATPMSPKQVLPSPHSSGRRLPALPLHSSILSRLPNMSVPPPPPKSDHTLCFIEGMSDSAMARSVMEDSYYEDDTINGNSYRRQRKSFFSPDDSSGVSSCTTSDSITPTHRVQFSFIPRHGDEVLLDVGDAVHVERTCEDHWCFGTNLRTGHSGIFPSAVVCEIDLVEEICLGALPTSTKILTNDRDTFYLTMLASIEVAHHKGNDILIQAMNKVLSMYKNHEEVIVPQTVLMEISFRGIHVIDKRKKNFFQCPTFDFFYSLQNISFCGAHPKQLKYFGFVTKHPLLPRFACHVFMSNASTQPIVEAIGRAFKRSYDEYMAFAHPTEDIYLE